MGSFKPEVFVQGSWSSNALRFATQEEAEKYAFDLMMRWTLVNETRVVPDSEPVNYRWDSERGAVSLKVKP